MNWKENNNCPVKENGIQTDSDRREVGSMSTQFIVNWIKCTL